MATTEEQLAELGWNPEDYSRDALIKKLPGLEKVLPEHEKHHGTLINGGCAGRFKDGRFVILLQYENAYLLVFFNPANPKESEEKNVSLSREAMAALAGLYQLLGNGQRDGDAYMEHLEERESA